MWCSGGEEEMLPEGLAGDLESAKPGVGAAKSLEDSAEGPTRKEAQRSWEIHLPGQAETVLLVQIRCTW